MQVSVETLSTLERRLKVVVPAEKLTAEFDKRIAGIAKNARIAGFRPGKAPLHIIKQKFGNSARSEALSEVIQASLFDALRSHKLNPAGTPHVEPLNITPDQPLEFVATLEVYPDVSDVQFTPAQIEKEAAKVAEADIDFALEKIRSQDKHWVIADRACQTGDRVKIDFVGKLEGEAFPGGAAQGHQLVLGNGGMIPGFEEGIVGMQAGEEKIITVTFPAEYHAKTLAGKEATFDITVHTVEAAELPPIDAEFVKKFGIESGEVSELRKEIHENLVRECDRLIKARLKETVFAELLAQNPLDLPKALVEREASRLHASLHAHSHHGRDTECNGHDPADMARLQAAAQRNVRLNLVAGGLLEKHAIKVSNDAIRARLEQLAAPYDDAEKVINWYYGNAEALKQVESMLMEELLVDKLLEGVTVVEKPTTYQTLIAAHQ